MKKKISTLIGILLISLTLFASSYCNGWGDGYVAGYRYNKPNTYSPFVPYCPYPQYGRDSYTDGYNRGFLKGLSDSSN